MKIANGISASLSWLVGCFGLNGPLRQYFSLYQGWSGGVIMLGIFPVPGRPTIWITVEQGSKVCTALTVGAGGIVWTF